ncbi:AAC(3)-I family aminoglycoside N-acetyltransferase [Yoonia vestfoldensis]|uniref:AAC(3)-I family aminoglycoside N-acetyltransferase n=1 Tax=Yoonia vestfoldensis TaxID=245188 RepID=UPI00035E1563|nr:AAC(3)-I family aminoglycoside N-acetyltransferase [Yoonia vestfoldensis]
MTQTQSDLAIHRLRPGDDARFDAMLDLFAEAFDDPDNYAAARPGQAYRNDLLARGDVVALVAVTGADVVGALVAYELRKFEQERSEFYIYDLAVAEAWRRCGIATAIITALKEIATARGGAVIYVQADHGDDPAIALYTKLGTREDVMHFDLPLD